MLCNFAIRSNRKKEERKEELSKSLVKKSTEGRFYRKAGKSGKRLAFRNQYVCD